MLESRREFIKNLTALNIAGLITAYTPDLFSKRDKTEGFDKNLELKWYQRSFRRYLLDFHIDDWNPSFLSKFDPEEYACCVEMGGGTAATIFANTCTGLCNYPTKVGAVHNNLKGRDLLKEIADALHSRNLDVIMYYSTVYNVWYWDHFPKSRTVNANGVSEKIKINCTGNPRRFATCCPNNPEYREFVVNQLNEICDNYEFEGMWSDMGFWPTVCYCEVCKERYKNETGREIPRTINWADPAWVGFHRLRQRWIHEFDNLVTTTIKNKKPDITVVHQSLAFTQDWMAGASPELCDVTDWLSTDYYGGRYALSYAGRIMYSMSKIKPFELLNCWNHPHIHEHVITRTEDMLRCVAYSAFIHHGAMTIIDQIDPDGTIHTANYKKVGRVFNELKQFEPYAGGHPCQDVGLYYSLNSIFDMADNGKPVISARYMFEPGRAWQHPSAHINAARSVATMLIQHHIPFGVVTKRNLSQLSDYQVIVLPNVVMLDDEEIGALRAYVQNGGCLYASKYTSFIDSNGSCTNNFLLADLFGVDWEGKTKENITYVCPEKEFSGLFPGFNSNIPITLRDKQILVKITGKNTRILATVTLPYKYPAEDRHASILTDPPGRKTDYPSLVLNQFGKGKVIYSAGGIETWDHDSQRQVFVNLIRSLLSKSLFIETNAHKSVEMTLFDQTDQKRLILHILNFQQELPNIPVRDIRIKVRMDQKKPEKVICLPGKTELKSDFKNGVLEFTVHELINYGMLGIDYT